MPLQVIRKSAGVGLAVKSKSNQLSKISINAGWDLPSGGGGLLGSLFGGGGAEYDLDIFAAVYEGSRHSDTCFYGNKSGVSGLSHGGDNLTGKDSASAAKISSEGLLNVEKPWLAIDESLVVNFAQLKPGIDTIFVGINIYEASSRKQSFENVKNAFLCISDADGKPLYLFDVSKRTSTGLIAIKITKQADGDWQVTNLDLDVNGNISQIVRFANTL